MIELEKTYLVKYLPEGLRKCDHKEILDIYIPESSRHPVVRIRKYGEQYEITKKEPVAEDSSIQTEQTVKLNQEEFEELNKLPGKRVRKIRYYYDYQGRTAEIDVFQDKLLGLVWVDFEFEGADEKDSFSMPEFCLADVTQEEFIAGGMLAGKSYQDIEEDLTKFNYNKLFLD